MKLMEFIFIVYFAITFRVFFTAFSLLKRINNVIFLPLYPQFVFLFKMVCLWPIEFARTPKYFIETIFLGKKYKLDLCRMEDGKEKETLFKDE